jgi:hypothetical protein
VCFVCVCVCVCACVCVWERVCVYATFIWCSHVHAHTHTKKYECIKVIITWLLVKKKLNRARGIVCQEEFIRYTTKVCLCVVHIGLCACACMSACECVCIQIFQQTSKSPSALHCYTPSALRLTSCAFSDCILCLRVYTPPDILSVSHRHTSRMLTYAVVCWRMLTYANVYRPGSPSASHCHTPSFLLPQLTPTSTRISTLGLCVSK